MTSKISLWQGRFVTLCAFALLTNSTGGAALAADVSSVSSSVDTRAGTDSVPSSHRLLQQAYEQLVKSNFEEAVPTLCKVVQVDRNSPTARRYLAFALLQEGHPKEALTQLQALKSIQANSSSFDLLLLGVASDMSGKRSEALSIYKELMVREPSSDYYRTKTIDELCTLLQYDEASKLASDGYNNAKEPKIAAIYQQKLKKIHSIERLTGRSHRFLM